MPTPALHLLCARLGLKAYEPTFLSTGQTDLTDLGRSIQATIWGTDPGIGTVPFGFVSVGADGPIATFRGTQRPKGTWVEWLDDLDAVLEPVPFLYETGAFWHRGFGRVYSSLTLKQLDGTESALSPVLSSLAGLICHGHSLGAPLATYAALGAKASKLILFASPKAGDTLLRQVCATVWDDIPSYENPNDVVPKVPITVDEPWKLEDFQQVGRQIPLSAALVTPPIASDWDSSHNLGSYLALLQAVP